MIECSYDCPEILDNDTFYRSYRQELNRTVVMMIEFCCGCIEIFDNDTFYRTCPP